MYNYRGGIHIHTSYSDGTGTIPQIARAANQAGLDYIIITDHETLEGVKEEGMYGNTAVIVGTELNRNANHYLALETNDNINDYSDNPRETIEEVNRQKGFGFMAHPFETGSPLITDGAAFPWTDLTVEGYTGIELWNYCSVWKGKALSIGRILSWYIIDRDKPVKEGPPAECLKFWDEQTQKRPVVVVGGTDNHAINYRLGFLNLVVFPYKDLFHTVNTHIVLNEKLSREFHVAKRQILTALKEGRCYVSFDRYKADRNFYFGAFNSEEAVPMGSQIHFREGTLLKIHSPGNKSLIKIVKNGAVISEKYCTSPKNKTPRKSFVHRQNKEKNSARSQTKNQPREQFTPADERANPFSHIFEVPGPGTYRAEIHYLPRRGRPLPWIYSNPVYIK